MSRICPSRLRSSRRSRYIHSTASSAVGVIDARVSSWRGDSITSSLAPRGLIMSNIPTPSRTNSHSIRKYASGSGTTRTLQPGLFAIEPSGRNAVISGPVRCSAPGQYGQSVWGTGLAFGRMRIQCPRVGSFLSSSTDSPSVPCSRDYHSRRRGGPPHTFGDRPRPRSRRGERRRRRPRRGGRLVLDLILELSQMLPRDVDPILFGGERRRQLDVPLPLGDRRLGIDLLVDQRQVVHGARVLAVDLDHAP